MQISKITKVGIVVIVIIVFLLSSTFVLLYPNDDNGRENFDEKNSNYNEKIIGNTSYGQVTKLGSFGNESSDVKIAYIIGVHPMESKIHDIFLESLRNKKNLRYSYYVYKVNVSQDREDYEKGRMNGQLLANEFVVEDIANNDFDLAMDIHSNIGIWAENQFIFSPSEGNISKSIAIKISEKISWLSYYYPPNPTSPPYITIPINEKGIPALVFEEYTYNSQDVKEKNANEFISVVDNLSLNKL